MGERAFVRWAPPLGALVTLVVGWAWCSRALEYGSWFALVAGLGSAIPVYVALRLAARKSQAGGARNRVLGLMAGAGGLLLAVGLVALLTPGIGRDVPTGTVALVGAAIYLAAVLFELARGRGKGR